MDIEDFLDKDKITLEEVVSRVICFNNVKDRCKCLSALDCKDHGDYNMSALSTILLLQNVRYEAVKKSEIN